MRSEEFILARSNGYFLWRIEIIFRMPLIGGVSNGLAEPALAISSVLPCFAVVYFLSFSGVVIRALIYDVVPLAGAYIVDFLLILISR